MSCSYEEALNQLSDSKIAILRLNEDLAQAKYELCDSVRKLEALTEVLENKGIDLNNEEVMENIEKEVDNTSFSLHKLSVSNDRDSLETISCKLCGEVVEFENMDSHSKRCSTSSPIKEADISKWIEDITRQDNSLAITLTRSNPLSGETAPFKVITKMKLSDNKHSCVEVYRSHGDFYWLHSAIQAVCPERIIPPLQHHISLYETITEFQRFLNRLSSHINLRTHPVLYTFLFGSNEKIRLSRISYRQSRSELISTPPEYRPQTRAGDQETSLADTKNYLQSLEGNLLGLLNHFQEIRKLNYGGAGKWLEAVSANEPRDTYTKVVIKDISKIFKSMNNQEGEDSIEDWTFVQNLQSTIQYITSAKGLLERIEQSMDKYLFWEEEVQNCENANYQHSSYTPSNHGDTTPICYSLTDSNEDLSVFDDSGLSESGASSNNGVQSPSVAYANSSLSQKWAEANSQCRSAREELENMCNNLAEELIHFDYLKEKDLKNILIDFVNTQHELMQKQQSKWYAMKLLLESPIEIGNRSIEFIYEEQEAT
ncbi:Sorting nexin-30 [Oopsacas minuta]|uniref:Sorting nexin-30 n=1 Tax=Oopsacas minuta TaxID=111878 RepID=A0AAV7J9C6_9METZ|nr:Sorting nexin-30 [Oopsacas minuta]